MRINSRKSVGNAINVSADVGQWTRRQSNAISRQRIRRRRQVIAGRRRGI